MAARSVRRPISPAAKAALQEAWFRIKMAVSARYLWERVLTEQERHRLGGDFEAAWRQRGTAGMWMELHGVSASRAIVEVAHAVGLLHDSSRRWLLRELGEFHDDLEELIQAAVSSSALVVIDHPRTAYWKGKEIVVDWNQRPALWDFFWECCRHAKTGQPIDAMTFNSTDASFVAKQ